MNYPYEVGIPYLTQKQLAHIEEFLEVMPQSEHTYTNKSGESRMAIRVFVPPGTITKNTKFSTDLKTNKTYYFTEESIGNNADKTAQIIYVQNGKSLDCNSVDWLKWLGKDFSTIHTPPPDNTQGAVIPMEAMIKMATAEVKGKSDVSSGEWAKPGTIKSAQSKK